MTRTTHVGKPDVPRHRAVIAAGTKARFVRCQARSGVYYVGMPQVVEINLRLPSFRAKAIDPEPPKVVDNSGVRYTKQVELDEVPKPGQIITMSAAGSVSFPCEVLQVNWHESKNIFVIACKYGRPRIDEADYTAINTSPDWTVSPLL